MGGRRAAGLGRLGAAPVPALAVLAQDPAEAGLAGQVGALVGQHGDDARGRQGGEVRLVGHR